MLGHPVRAVGLGLLRVRRVLGKVGGGLGAVTRWVLTHLQRCEFKFLKDYTDTVLIEISRLPLSTKRREGDRAAATGRSSSGGGGGGGSGRRSSGRSSGRK